MLGNGRLLCCALSVSMILLYHGSAIPELYRPNQEPCIAAYCKFWGAMGGSHTNRITRVMVTAAATARCEPVKACSL